MRIVYVSTRARYEAIADYDERKLCMRSGLAWDGIERCWYAPNLRAAYDNRFRADEATQAIMDSAMDAVRARREAKAQAQIAEAQAAAAYLVPPPAPPAAPARGRPPLGEQAMTGAERMQASRSARGTSTVEVTPDVEELLGQLTMATGHTRNVVLLQALQTMANIGANQV